MALTRPIQIFTGSYGTGRSDYFIINTACYWYCPFPCSEQQCILSSYYLPLRIGPPPRPPTPTSTPPILAPPWQCPCNGHKSRGPRGWSRQSHRSRIDRKQEKEQEYKRSRIRSWSSRCQDIGKSASKCHITPEFLCDILISSSYFLLQAFAWY